MYMLVSHRNMISVFDMTKVKGKNAKRMDTFKFEDGNIRQMFIKKTSKEDRLDLIWNKIKRDEDIRTQTDLSKSKHMLSIFQ